MSNKKIAIITTHPIQYYAPLFRLLSKENNYFSIKVFYTLSQAQEKMHDKDFGISFQWDVPLLEGYNYSFVPNVSDNPGSRSLRGIINPMLHKKIEEWMADAVLVIGWAFESHLKALRFFHGKIPVLFKGDSNLIDEAAGISLKKMLRRIFLKWVYSHVDYALYVGKANKDYYLAHGLKSSQLYFSPHAVDNDRFTMNESDTEKRALRWRLDLGIGRDEFVFLFAGKLTRKKDPELLIKAFIAIHDHETKLIIIGTGELEAELKKQYSHNQNITFLPFQNQSMMPVVYRLANIFVLPSIGPGETWGLAVNEAMACKRGVIVSDKCGCVADLLVHQDKNGYIFTSGDIESLKNSMRLSIKRFKELGSCSFQIIQDYSYAHTYNQLKFMTEKNLI